METRVLSRTCDTEMEMGMHAIDPDSGAILSKWVADTQCYCPEGGAFICNTFNSQPIIDFDGNIYAIDELLGVVKFDPSSLETGPVWNTKLNMQNYYHATFNADETRVYASSQPEFGGFDPETGFPDFIEPYPSGFQLAAPVWGESALAISSSGAVYTTAGDLTQCHDATDGSLLWSRSRITELVVVSDSEVVAITGSSVVSLNTIPPPTEAPTSAPTNAPTTSSPTTSPTTAFPTLSPTSAAPTTGSPTDVASTVPSTAPSITSGAAKHQISFVAMMMMLVLSHFL
eukprot:scaffold74307_cov51-Attheya_sp.AAC.2